VEASGADGVLPLAFDAVVRGERGFVQAPAARGEADDPRAAVLWVRVASQIAEALQLAKPIVGGLLADVDGRRQLRRPHPVGAGPAEERDVHRSHVGEAGVHDTAVDALAYVVEREAQEGADRERGRRRR